MDNKTLLEWQFEAGVDEAIDDMPVNYFALKTDAMPKKSALANNNSPVSPTPLPVSSTPNALPYAPYAYSSAVDNALPLHLSPSEATDKARQLADSCKSVADLEKTVTEFNGCAIKKTATKTVFADGNPESNIMIIGDIPNAQEDVQGTPFHGKTGELLDKMLAAIGLDRTNAYLTNGVFWRPPGNRQPNAEEIATCLPFVEKHIALVSPAILVLLGGVSANALLQKDQSISRLRGTLYDYSNQYLDTQVKTVVMYHPSHLLKHPVYKKHAWQDLLMVKKNLERNR